MHDASKRAEQQQQQQQQKTDKNVIKLYFDTKLSLLHNKHCTLDINKNFVFYCNKKTNNFINSIP